jgi:FtsZ-binding cell division protein ZapB
MRELVLKLMDLHTCKHERLKEMYEATLDRGFGVDIEKTDEIIAYMDARQRCIERIDLLDIEIEETGKRLDLLYEESGLSHSIDREMGEVEKLKAAQHELVGQIIQRDHEYERHLQQAFEELKKSRGKISAGRKAFNAYKGRNNQSGSLFLDEKK